MGFSESLEIFREGDSGFIRIFNVCSFMIILFLVFSDNYWLRFDLFFDNREAPLSFFSLLFDDQLTDTIGASFSGNFIDYLDFFRTIFNILNFARKTAHEMNKVLVIFDLMNDLMNVGLSFIHFVQQGS